MASDLRFMIEKTLDGERRRHRLPAARRAPRRRPAAAGPDRRRKRPAGRARDQVSRPCGLAGRQPSH
ncbi:MAG: hypothetical protein MZW92_13430 [Comamonadaceae bacterium]|nr:hypothetical protein [Comamonadaceae bacterium]